MTGISFQRWPGSIRGITRRRHRSSSRQYWRSSWCWWSGKFAALFSITLFAEWLFYMLTTSTVFIFRKKQPDAPRPYRVWGYPVVPAIFVLCSAVLLFYTFKQNVKNSAWGSLVMLAGVPIYYLFASRKEKTRPGKTS
jgi:amino acid transporter